MIRWAQMYSAVIEGRYTWINYRRNYFPVFDSLLEKQSLVDYEIQTNEA